jgi:hypothetical protein
MLERQRTRCAIVTSKPTPLPTSSERPIASCGGGRSREIGLFQPCFSSSISNLYSSSGRIEARSNAGRVSGDTNGMNGAPKRTLQMGLLSRTGRRLTSLWRVGQKPEGKATWRPRRRWANPDGAIAQKGGRPEAALSLGRKRPRRAYASLSPHRNKLMLRRSNCKHVLLRGVDREAVTTDWLAGQPARRLVEESQRKCYICSTSRMEASQWP